MLIFYLLPKQGIHDQIETAFTTISSYPQCRDRNIPHEIEEYFEKLWFPPNSETMRAITETFMAMKDVVYNGHKETKRSKLIEFFSIFLHHSTEDHIREVLSKEVEALAGVIEFAEKTNVA